MTVSSPGRVNNHDRVYPVHECMSFIAIPRPHIKRSLVFVNTYDLEYGSTVTTLESLMQIIFVPSTFIYYVVEVILDYTLHFVLCSAIDTIPGMV